jgi:hypothetical protein
MEFTDKQITDWAREHKVGTKKFGLTIFQYVQDDNANVYVVVPLDDFMAKDYKRRKAE